MTAVLAALLLAAGGAAEKPKLVVLELTAQQGVEASLASSLSDAVTAEVAARGFFQASSSHEIQTLLGVERQRQLLGCSDEGACQTELAGAMGARFVLSGQLSKVGDAYQLTLQTLDTQKAVTVARSMRLVKEVNALRDQLPYAVAEATGTPLPPPPSHILPYSMIAAGGALIIAGGVLGLNTVVQEGQITSELKSQTQLHTYGYYVDQRSTLGQQRTFALVGLLAGAGLLGAGLYLNPDNSGTRIALVPAPGGIGIAGVWP
jgi:hypothetical protein